MDLIMPRDKVRCIDSRNSKGALKSGAIYTVLWSRSYPNSVILEEIEGDWLQSRFELEEKRK